MGWRHFFPRLWFTFLSLFVALSGRGYRKLAERGDAFAQNELGLLYAQFGYHPSFKGTGRIYIAEANSWYRKAAEQGHAHAQFNLGLHYAKGLGLPKDYVAAYNWLSRAVGSAATANRCSPFARFSDEWPKTLVAAEALRRQIAQDMTPEQLAWTDEHLAALRQRAEGGDAAAQFDFGLALAKGRMPPDGHLWGELWPEFSKDYQEPDFVEAIKWWRKSAKRGDMRAQINLGNLYWTGRWDIGKNEEEALRWFRSAAEAGHVGAQHLLGLAYDERAWSRWLDEDEDEAHRSSQLAMAAHWFRKAADTGHAGAQLWLGACYGEGRGVSCDHNESAKWYRKAAEQGAIGAYIELGNKYAAGEGVPKNFAEAARWYRADVYQGGSSWNAESQTRLGYMYAVGEGVPQDYAEAAKLFRKVGERHRWEREGDWYSPLLKAYEEQVHFPRTFCAEAIAWLCGAADEGWPPARLAIEQMQEAGERKMLDDSKRHPGASQYPGDWFSLGDLRQTPETLNEFRVAAEQGDTNAHLALGLIKYRFYSDDEESETAEAVASLHKAAQQGITFAARILGSIYDEGQGIARDRDKAEVYYRIAAEQGDAIAQYEVGRILHTTAESEWERRLRGKSEVPRDSSGCVVPPNEYYEAAEWYSKAAMQGHAQAQYLLAELLTEGRGVPKDERTAAELLRKAATQGYERAQKELANRYRNGTGVPKDQSAAIRWARKADAATPRLGLLYFYDEGVPEDGDVVAESLAVLTPCLP